MTPTQPPLPLHCVQAGPPSSIPIVLLHSAALDLTYWDQQISALGTHHRIVAIDLPGHGDSPGDAELWRGGHILDAVDATLRSEAAGRWHLVGLSFGGVLAQGLALRKPDRVASLTLLDTGARFSDPARAAMRARAELVRAQGVAAAVDGLIGHWFLPATVNARPDLIVRATRTILSQDREVHAAMWEHIAAVDIADEISQIACPTRVIVGEHDPSSPLQTAQALRDAIPGARLSVIPHAAHLSVLERPEVVNQLIAQHVMDAA